MGRSRPSWSRFSRFAVHSALGRLFLLTGSALAAAPSLLSSGRIWDQAPHNAFTDLIRFQDQWLCVFREGSKHVSPDGAVRVIISTNGEAWSSVARIQSDRGDLRDPKIVRTPQGQWMLTAAIALPANAAARHQTLAWFSSNGRDWGSPIEIGEANLWLWRVTWLRDHAFGVAYDTAGENFVRLYASDDGRKFQTLVPRLFDHGQPNESSLVFEPDDTALCLLRRDGSPGNGLLGVARPPYRDWEWKDLGTKIGGPHLLRLDDGRLISAVRLYDGGARTSLAWIDRESGRLTEALKLPSGGDTSYAGLVWDKPVLWVSYYSSHEGKTAIYLAKVRLPLN